MEGEHTNESGVVCATCRGGHEKVGVSVPPIKGNVEPRKEEKQIWSEVWPKLGNCGQGQTCAQMGHTDGLQGPPGDQRFEMPAAPSCLLSSLKSTGKKHVKEGMRQAPHQWTRGSPKWLVFY